jgi:hypothetical protein
MLARSDRKRENGQMMLLATNQKNQENRVIAASPIIS